MKLYRKDIEDLQYNPINFRYFPYQILFELASKVICMIQRIVSVLSYDDHQVGPLSP